MHLKKLSPPSPQTRSLYLSSPPLGAWRKVLLLPTSFHLQALTMAEAYLKETEKKSAKNASDFTHKISRKTHVSTFPNATCKAWVAVIERRVGQLVALQVVFDCKSHYPLPLLVLSRSDVICGPRTERPQVAHLLSTALQDHTHKHSHI